MNTENFTKETENFFSRELSLMGFVVREIEESEEERPDLLVNDGEALYLIEIKNKFDDKDKVIDIDKRLENGEIVEESTQICYNNNLSGIVKHAANQLMAFKDETVDFRLIWLHAQGHSPDLQNKLFQATLYGKVDFFNLETNKSKPCYYYMNAEFFYRRNEIDGAIISTEKGAKFCLNDYSLNYVQLKNSNLCNKFGKAVIDPIAEEIAGKAYSISDCKEDRKKGKEVFKFLRNKYPGEKLTRTNWHYYVSSQKL